MTRSRYSKLSQVKLHYLEEGDGDVVVLLHGWPHTSHSWRHVIPKLSPKYRVIAPDMRGLGDSSRPAAGYDNGAVAGDVIELLDSHGVREFSLVGHDWGGPVAFAATLLAQDRVQKLALVDAVLAGEPPTAAVAGDRHGRVSVRIALRQMKSQGYAPAALTAWLASYDQATPDEADDEAALHHEG